MSRLSCPQGLQVNRDENPHPLPYTVTAAVLGTTMKEPTYAFI